MIYDIILFFWKVMSKALYRSVLKLGAKTISVVLYPVVCLMNQEELAFIPPIKDPLFKYSATTLARKIRQKEIKSEDVVRKYITRCCQVNPIINAIVDTRYETAIAEAKNVDVLISSGSHSEEELENSYPLLGVPITIKESIAVKGMSYNCGVYNSKVQSVDKDAKSVLRLREAGGIPILVSNTPELCLCWETFNYTIGTTRNPYDTRKTAGGSSGGEAALIASAASVVGLGSDSAGSLRLPALYNGIFAHKPTPLAVSLDGHVPWSSVKDWPFKSCVGPMTRYAEDLTLMMKVLNDPNGHKLDLDKQVSLKNMRFYYMEGDDSGITSQIDSDTRKAIKNLLDHFETKHGITVKKVKLKNMEFIMDVCIFNMLKVGDLNTVFEQPLRATPVTVELVKKLFGYSYVSTLSILHAYLRIMEKYISEEKFTQARVLSSELRFEFLDLLQDDAVCFYPTFKTTATSHYDYIRHIGDYSYLTLFNSLGLPVTNCPLGLTSRGMPVGIQVITSPGCDHLSIHVAKELERAFGGWIPPPQDV